MPRLVTAAFFSLEIAPMQRNDEHRDLKTAFSPKQYILDSPSLVLLSLIRSRSGRSIAKAKQQRSTTPPKKDTPRSPPIIPGAPILTFKARSDLLLCIIAELSLPASASLTYTDATCASHTPRVNN